MSEAEDATKVREFWERAAASERDEQGLRPVARDPFLQEAVEAGMERWLDSRAKVADIGCGDGYSTLRFARNVASIVGVDYIPKFVDRARDEARQRGVSNASFRTGNVLDLEPIRAEEGPVDIAISIRCLINLNNWDQQRQGMEQIARTVRPGGLWLVSEGWSGGLRGLNELRKHTTLPPIVAAKYNVLIEREQFEAVATSFFKIEAYINLGFYLVMSRVLQPLVELPYPARHDHPINQLAANLQDGCSDSTLFRDCDYAGIYVLRRNGV
ncbi:bifunctional 2-polyprenyl-6-hydroxyphenol methylase/3-demethylubiquinol 3-O-methyltransferase UbiG [Bradyrhizobium sp. JYMT SZCCT0428]|uniref:class I SAM-dependent methyltransferase n=1 Tax=Bradyrhizobium sp. JYMT SZCCT0428 TaxID=2807673 RepID=UPI001BA599CC|nr:class I SAM-dependent methyltransferase [Bradyrhizobium sp. JYMT SZCCT0428]MBR1156125.1 class I SAM-dependent methyltransferase [Bradyrhizobium sp. JYMT SZCCT0428]